MSVEEARAALEMKAQHYGTLCAAHSVDAGAYRALIEAGDAYALAAHIEACQRRELVTKGNLTYHDRLCGNGWLCERAEAIKGLGAKS